MVVSHKKVALITGASSGIGEALAYKLAREGCVVVLAARNTDKLQAIAEKIKQQGGEALALRCDVSEEADCSQVVNECILHFGRLDIVIANAGISMRATLEDSHTSVLHQVMNINFWGMVYCFKYAQPYVKQSRGNLVAISSVAGFRGLPARTAYSASKGAMNLFVEALRCELLESGVSVQLICPGYTASNIRNAALNERGEAQGDSPLDESKLMSAESVATATWQAIQKRRRTVVLGGEEKLALWLNRWAPAWLDKLLYRRLKKEKGSPLK